MPKNSKRGHSGSLNVFTNRKLQKKCKGVPFDRIRKFSKSRIVPKKTKQKNQTKKGNEKTFGLASTFGSIKNICGLVRESNPRSPASQKIS